MNERERRIKPQREERKKGFTGDVMSREDSESYMDGWMAPMEIEGSNNYGVVCTLVVCTH